MKIKAVSVAKAVPATATSVSSTTVDLSADPQKFPFAEGASAVVSINLNAIKATGGTVVLQSSTDGSTFNTAKDDAGNNISVALGATAVSGVRKFNAVNLGQAIRVHINVTSGTAGAGTVDCYLEQN